MFKTYKVEAKLKNPGYYNRGYDMTICAKSKAEAIKQARKQVQDMGHTRQDGPLTYTAHEE